VIRTLRTYLAKELLKATLLATAAFTLVMTVFAVIEPLRKEGVSPYQAFKLFGYITPVMFSLTLPVAALFGATIVYGRFSRDNELMACRASGISTLSLLAPAIWLGAIVSVITLVLGFFVAPNLLGASERMIKENLQQIAYNKLMRQQYIKFRSSDLNLIFHADRVEPKSPWAQGIIILDHSDPENAKCLVAASAKLQFIKRNGKSLVEFFPTNPTVFQQSGENIGLAEQVPFRRGELPTIKDKPKFYDWNKLYLMLKHPENHPRIARKITQIQHEICFDNLYIDIVRQIKSHGRYELTELPANSTEQPSSKVVIQAGRARIEKARAVRLLPAPEPTTHIGTTSPGSEKGHNRILITQYDNGRVKRRIWAESALVKGLWDKFHASMAVVISLQELTILPAGEQLENARRQKKCDLGPFAMPERVLSSSRRPNPETIEQLRTSPSKRIRKLTRHLFGSAIPKLKRKIWAEIHQRLAYSISCLLMVMLGAVLGILFRGGEVLTAFAISILPSSAVIIMIIMGKQLMTNVNIPSMAYGVAVIWTGIAALTGVTSYFYAGPMRR